jgi:hypothetical protein
LRRLLINGLLAVAFAAVSLESGLLTGTANVTLAAKNPIPTAGSGDQDTKDSTKQPKPAKTPKTPEPQKKPTPPPTTTTSKPPTDTAPVPSGKVGVCHATGSASNPFTFVVVDNNATFGGHGNHVGDLIGVDKANDCPKDSKDGNSVNVCEKTGPPNDRPKKCRIA